MPARSREAPCRLSAPSLACLFLGIFFIVQQVGHIPQADAQGGPVVQQCRGGGRQYPRHAQCDQRQVEAHDEAVAAVVMAKRRTAMQMIGRMILVILFIMLSPCRAGIAAQLKMSLISFL